MSHIAIVHQTTSGGVGAVASDGDVVGVDHGVVRARQREGDRAGRAGPARQRRGVGQRGADHHDGPGRGGQGECCLGDGGDLGNCGTGV